MACSAELVWHAGPANDGGGTAGIRDGIPWWQDGDLLLIIVDTNKGPNVSLLQVNADGDQLSFLDPETLDDNFGWTDREISWWARIEKSLPQNEPAQLPPRSGSNPTTDANGG